MTYASYVVLTLHSKTDRHDQNNVNLDHTASSWGV